MSTSSTHWRQTCCPCCHHSNHQHPDSDLYYTPHRPLHKSLAIWLHWTNPNHEFLDHFNEYINQEWAANYFAYDILKKDYHRIKSLPHKHAETYEDRVLVEIKRVNAFLADSLQEAEEDLQVISGTIEALQVSVTTGSEKRLKEAVLSQSAKLSSSRHSDQQQQQKHASSLKQRHHRPARKGLQHGFHPQHHPIEFITHSMDTLLQIAHKVETIVLDEEHASRKAKQLDHNIELAIRSIYSILSRLEMFHKLNAYAIVKIGKRVEKLYKSKKQALSKPPALVKPGHEEADTPSQKLKHANTYSPLHTNSLPNNSNALKGSDLEAVLEEDEDEEVEDDDEDEESSEDEEEDEELEDETTLFSSNIDSMTLMDPTRSNTPDRNSNHPSPSHANPSPALPPFPTHINEKPGSGNVSSKRVQVRQHWKDCISGFYYYRDFVQSGCVIKSLKQRCVDLYSLKFKKAHAELAEFELEFIENKDRNSKYTKSWISFKAGLMICMITWLAADSYSAERDQLNFWEQPSIYVYTTIFNVLLYRLFWAIDIAAWSKFGVNYISILELRNIKPNLVFVINQTTSLMLLFFISLLIFYRANAMKTNLDNSFVSYGSPLLLLIFSVAIQCFQTLFYYKYDSSRGLFNKRVVLNMLAAPFVALTFRDAYAADVLTSFNKVIADTLYASCWVISGSFLQKMPSGSSNAAADSHVELQQSSHFGSSFWQCKSQQMVLAVSILQLIPLITRLLQCLRGIYENNGKLFPFAFNAWKYLLSIFVVLFSIEGFQVSNDVYMFLVMMTTLYKWWWDVAMDWGLLDTMPQTWKDCCFSSMKVFMHKKYFLRSSLMYPHPGIYYFCIILNLFLRFIWVLSLAPMSYLGGLVGGKLSLLMGSMEIIRRSIWGIFRVEWEHVKLLKNSTPGFLPSHILRAHEWSQKYAGSTTSNSIRSSSGDRSMTGSFKSSKSSKKSTRTMDDDVIVSGKFQKRRRKSIWSQAVDELRKDDSAEDMLSMELPLRSNTYDEHDDRV